MPADISASPAAVPLLLSLSLVLSTVAMTPLLMSPPGEAVAAPSVPSGFADQLLSGGLTFPTSMDFAPDGRLFVTEQAGKLRVIKNGVLLATPFLSLSVDSYGERGLLGVAFDPAFSSNGYVYVYYTTGSSPVHNKVSRFTADPASPDRALAGSERVLLDIEAGGAWHNGGAIHFGRDDKLYIAVGDHGSASAPQSLSSRFGKILRINPDGTIPSDNPFYSTSGARKEVWALGLRNPFTFAFSQDGSKMYINDVGQDSWEEVNAGKPGANYGWPVCEGPCSSHTQPVYAYPHPATGAGRSIAGAAFYEAVQFPAQYRGSYFFGDYVAGTIRRLATDNTAHDFMSGVAAPVDLKVGPDGSLYYLSITEGSVHRVRYNSAGGANSPPAAVASASPASGTVPLAVSFDGSASSDPDGDPLSYSWNFGDGSATAQGAKVSHTYSKAGKYTATLTVSDGRGGTGSATVTVTAGGTPPSAAISSPAAGAKYSGGSTISFAGSATDAEDGGTLAASAFRWVVLLHHNTHTHPFTEFAGVKSGSFVIPTGGETSDDVFYRIYLTVTDSSGLSTTVTRDVTPNKATVTLASNVPGIQVYLDGQPRTTPHSFVGVAGITRTLQAPAEQTVNGQAYQFQSWSDGGAATHTISTPAADTTYTASYVAKPASAPTLTVASQDTNGNGISGYWTVLRTGGGSVAATGFTPVTFTLNSGQQYSVGMGDYGSYAFDHWLDNDSTANPRTVTISSSTQLVAVYRNTQQAPPPPPPPSQYPIVHMQDTQTSWPSLTYAGRQVNAEYVTAQSQLVGDKIDSITLRLARQGSPSGIAQVGVFNPDLSVKRLFGTVDVAALPTAQADYEFKLAADTELYAIAAGDRIGIRYTGGSSSSGVLVEIDRSMADPFDGTNSHRVRHESGPGWLYYDTGEDLYMTLKQTRGS